MSIGSDWAKRSAILGGPTGDLHESLQFVEDRAIDFPDPDNLERCSAVAL
jgi:hypothetical protein